MIKLTLPCRRGEIYYAPVRTSGGPQSPASHTDPDCKAVKLAVDWCQVMQNKNFRTTVGRLLWQMGMALVLALSLLAALAVMKRVYMVQEAFVVMFVTALLVTAILFLLVCFVLFQAGIRQAILWTIAVIPSLARFSHRQVATPDPIIPPHFHR